MAGRRAASSGAFLLVVGALMVQAERPGFQPLSDLSSYEIVVPRRLTRHRRGLPTVPQDEFSYEITIEGKDHILVVEKNAELVPRDFTVYTYKSDGTLQTERPKIRDFCHYQGYVEGVVNSLVAVNICFGIRGLIQIEKDAFGVDPIDLQRHVVYRLNTVKTTARSCGVASADNKCQSPALQHPPYGVPHLARRKRGVFLQTRYVELFIVVDKERYMLLGQNKTAVTEEMVHLANYLDSMYSVLNIRIVLVGLEIWTFQNKISIEGGAADVLANFVQWRERDLVPRRRHDSAQLILTKGFGEIAGMAYVGTICSKSNAGGVNVFGQIGVQMFASIVAHELGHNLGMNHDDERNCHCPTENCIMKSKASGARNFSSCSEEDFEKLTLNKGGSCLLNIPMPEETYSVPYCGNKLVDAGEECDCGSLEECKTDPCCEAGTCKLRSGAACGYGDCCRNCQYLSKGTECREKASECDLPEYCNGTSAFCPQDVTVQNGHPCNKGEAYCYNGACQYYEAQCQAIFGPKAKAAPEICFSVVNSKGDRFGNCGYHNHDYKKCSSSNSMCGKLQCENVKTLPVFGIEPAIIQTPIKGSFCWGVDFQLGSDVPDPGMVNEGTKCAPGKICKHYQCVDVAVLGYDCDINNQCHGQGVCNSNKNCHCNSGWAPPYCDTKGYGGSVDSGPPYNDEDTTTRDWLLVFFFLILPLLLTSVFCYCMRKSLVYSLRPLIESCCGCFSRSRNRRQEPVGSEFPPSAPYHPRDTSSQINMQSKRYPVPSYTANQQLYGEPFHYTPPKPVVPSTEQHFIPTRPPPPALKTTKTQEPLIPSRPAPLPPK